MSKLLTTIPQSYLTEKNVLLIAFFGFYWYFSCTIYSVHIKDLIWLVAALQIPMHSFFFFLQFICFLFVSVTAIILDLKLIQSIYESLIYGLHLVRFMVTPNKQNTQSKLEVKTFLYLWFVSNFHISQISKHAKKSNRFYYVGSCYLFTLLIS